MPDDPNNSENERNLSEQILKRIQEKPGQQVAEIAASIGAEKHNVYALLYKELSNKCVQTQEYKWYLKGESPSPVKQQTRKSVDTPLKKLAEYYTACIAEDDGAKISVFAKSKFQPDYKELEKLPLEAEDYSALFESPESQRFLQDVRRDRSKKLYFGYPVLSTLLRSRRSSWSGYMLKPIFLFPIELQDDGSTNVDLNSPVINREVLQHFSDAKGEELMKELVHLEEDLGLSGEDEVPNLDDLVQRLYNVIKPEWDWTEKINPYKLPQYPPLSECDCDGIFNRAIILRVKESPSPYTKGLAYELNELSKLSEDQYADTALGQWVNRNVPHTNERNLQSVLELLPMNLEQRHAVSSSLVNNLTLITGPPGTGKSQVVTNLLINAAWQNKRILFASKNHKAVDVVETRVNEISTKPVLLRFGGQGDAQNRLITSLSNLLTATTSPQDTENFERAKIEYDSVQKKLLINEEEMDNLVLLRNQVDKSDKSLEGIRHTLGDLFSKYRNIDISQTQKELTPLLISLQKALSKDKNIITNLLFNIWKRRKYQNITNETQDLETSFKKINIEIPQQALDDTTIDNWRTFHQKIESRLKNIRDIRRHFSLLKKLEQATPLEKLTSERVSLLKKMSTIAEELWDLWLKIRSDKLSDTDRAALSQYKSTLQMVSGQTPSRAAWRSYYQQSQRVSHMLPAWAITSLSAKGRIPFQPGIFDIVVFDESSQCDIASALPLLYRAKRAVIIGDPKQLSHISSISKKQDERLLEKYGLLGSFNDWSYSYNSLFDLAAGQTVGNEVIDLRDHYRSHADIINFSNKTFYEERLRVATRYDTLKYPKNEKPGIRWTNVSGKAEKGPSGSGAQNQQEARAVVDELSRLVAQGYKGTIGVVSPFRAQANLINRMVNQEPELFESLLTRDFMSETVHRFQGDERDMIIFSPVISHGLPKGATLFLQRSGNLFNVAITRARASLVVVGDHESVLQSDVSYMADFARYISKLQQHNQNKSSQEPPLPNDRGSKYPTVSNPDQVSDWERILYEALYKAGIKTIPQYQEGLYTLDFALFIGDRKLNIEVDGEHYHKDWNGELCYRDQIRNQRMFELGWDVKRFWVYEIRDDLENCVQKVKNWIAHN